MTPTDLHGAPAGIESLRPSQSFGGVRGRVLVGVLALLAGVVHLWLAPAHLQEMHWLGVLFVIDGVGFIGSVAWLAAKPSTTAWFAMFLLASATASGYFISRTSGLPGASPEAWDSLGVVTTDLEILIAVLATQAWLFRLLGRRAT